MGRIITVTNKSRAEKAPPSPLHSQPLFRSLSIFLMLFVLCIGSIWIVVEINAGAQTQTHTVSVFLSYNNITDADIAVPITHGETFNLTIEDIVISLIQQGIVPMLPDCLVFTHWYLDPCRENPYLGTPITQDTKLFAGIIEAIAIY